MKHPKLPLIDPTANVLALVAAASLRQDDLRKAGDHRQRATSRLERQHRKAMQKLEAKYRDAQFIAEKARVDAQLADAKAAVALAATRTELTATALAERVDASAKALAMTQEQTAKTLAADTEGVASALSGRITPLEQVRYESAGGKEQRGETRQAYQWTVERILTIVGVALAGLYFILTNLH